MQHFRLRSMHKPVSIPYRISLSVFGVFVFLAMTLSLGLLDSGVAQAQEIEVFVANLSGAEEATPNSSIATGRAVMTVVSDTVNYTLYYRVTVADIDDVRMAHIHDGLPGTDGPVLFTLFDSSGGGTFDPSNPISGTVSLTAVQLDRLRAGDYYVNVHTGGEFEGGGEMRGQLHEEPLQTEYNALLLGANEVGPVDTPASAVANFTLTTTDTYTLTYKLTVADIISITAAHIHRGPVGVNGSIVHHLYDGVGPFDPNNPVTGTVNLNAQDILDLLTGNFYVNIHTEAHSGGEIRGQMGGAHLFDANLAAAHEVVPAGTLDVESIATGRAVLALSRDTTQLSYRLMVDDIDDITLAHIHRNVIGANGPVVHDIYTGTGTFDTEHPIAGTIVLTPGQVIDLISGRYYVNVHTGDFGSGEIRGQVEEFIPPTHLNAALTGAEEVPVVDTDAVGLARLRFDNQTNVLHHTLIVSDIVDVNMAHIHLGPPGVPGGVIFTLFNEADGGALGTGDPVGGGNELEAANLVDLFTGFYYVNVHTVAHGGGEIRGQIGHAQIYQASLSGGEEVQAQPVKSDATGRAVLALSDDTTSLAYRVLVNNIEDVNNAHIHRGERGVSGGVVIPLFFQPVFDPQQPISGTVAIEADQVLELIAGHYYVNVHTVAHGAGEIRGQIEPFAPRAHMHAVLTGDQETATTVAAASDHAHAAGIDATQAISTEAVGLTRLTLDPDLNMIRYTVAVTDIDNIIAAHIHPGQRGVAGPPRHFLYAGEGDFGPGEPVADALHFEAIDWVNLLTGFHYVNVHTTEHTAGEIRGQLVGSSLYQADLTGDQEVPPVDTPGTGRAVLALSADTTQFVYQVSVTDTLGTIVAAHIHKAPPGVDGDIIFPLDTSSNPLSGTVSLNTEQIFDLLQGLYYVNIHTSVETGGEIRGQVEPFAPPLAFVASLTTDAEVPHVSQDDPHGKASFALEADTGVLQYSLIVTDVEDITAAHIHTGPVGVNGPVAFVLYMPPGEFDPDHPIGGSLVLDAPQLVALLTEFYYVNVHTGDAPDGFIRGQIVVPAELLRLSLPTISKGEPPD